jgi:hypothetical protein
MQVTASLNMLIFDHYIAIASTRRGGHDVLVKRKWNEDNKTYEIYNSANSSHCFRAEANISPGYPCH